MPLCLGNSSVLDQCYCAWATAQCHCAWALAQCHCAWPTAQLSVWTSRRKATVWIVNATAAATRIREGYQWYLPSSLASPGTTVFSKNEVACDTSALRALESLWLRDHPALPPRTCQPGKPRRPMLVHGWCMAGAWLPVRASGDNGGRPNDWRICRNSAQNMNMSACVQYSN